MIDDPFVNRRANSCLDAPDAERLEWPCPLSQDAIAEVVLASDASVYCISHATAWTVPPSAEHFASRSRAVQLAKDEMRKKSTRLIHPGVPSRSASFSFSYAVDVVVVRHEEFDLGGSAMASRRPTSAISFSRLFVACVLRYSRVYTS